MPDFRSDPVGSDHRPRGLCYGPFPDRGKIPGRQINASGRMTDLRPTNKLKFYLSRMASRGFTPEQVLNGTGIRVDQIDDEFFVATPGQYRRIILNIMLDLTKDPFIGIALGSEYKISYLGILGYAALSAETLEKSRDLFTKYQALDERVFSSTNYISGGRWYSEIRDTFLLGDVIRFVVEEFVSQTIELATSLTNRSFPILELYVTYPPPSDLKPYMQRFNCPLHFNQPRNIVVFDINRLHDPISLANEEVFKLCERQCRLLMSGREDGELLSNRIRNYLIKNPGEFPTLEKLAKKLNLSSRTLRRRLIGEDVTYHQILDETRRELALQYLQYTSLTPKEISFHLGYSNVSNFRRAFKSWTGKKLTDIRNSGDIPGPGSSWPIRPQTPSAPR